MSVSPRVARVLFVLIPLAFLLPVRQGGACDDWEWMEECACIPFQEEQLDMNALIERLKQTKAIGFLTKLALRSDALDLIEMAKQYKRHPTEDGLKALRSRYEGLVLKVLALLEKDPQLARDIALAREKIWHHLLEANA